MELLQMSRSRWVKLPYPIGTTIYEPYLENGQPVAWVVKGYVIEKDAVYLIVGDDSGYRKKIHEKRASGTEEEARRKII